MPHFMIVLMPYVNLLNLSWIIKCPFLRNMEPLPYLCLVSHKKPLANSVDPDQKPRSVASDQDLHFLN